MNDAALHSERPSDGELLLRLERRDVDAFQSLYRRHAGYVTAIALRILHSQADAEDVVQDVFWKLWKSRIRYEPGRGRFTTWLFTVARNRALDRVRQRSRATPAEGDGRELENEPAQHDPESDAHRAEMRAGVQQALAALPEEQRTALELAFFEGLTHVQVAERTGAPLGTVKARIRRGMERLKLELRDPGAPS